MFLESLEEATIDMRFQYLVKMLLIIDVDKIVIETCTGQRDGVLLENKWERVKFKCLEDRSSAMVCHLYPGNHASNRVIQLDVKASNKQKVPE